MQLEPPGGPGRELPSVCDRGPAHAVDLYRAGSFVLTIWVHKFEVNHLFLGM